LARRAKLRGSGMSYALVAQWPLEDLFSRQLLYQAEPRSDFGLSDFQRAVV